MIMKRKYLPIGCLLFVLASCTTYRELSIDVLKPSALDLKPGEKIAFADRNIVQTRDSASARFLQENLYLSRADLVNAFYEGVRDGIKWGGKELTVKRVEDPDPVIYPESLEKPDPLTLEEIRELVADQELSYLLSVEFCKFRLSGDGRSVDLNNHMLLRLYDVTNADIVDEIESQRLASTARIHPGDPTGSTREYVYQKGWSYAERITPMWIPDTRRIYTGHRMLDVGHIFFEEGNYEQAGIAWKSAMDNARPSVSVMAAINLSWLYERTGHFEEALEMLQGIKLPENERKLTRDLQDYLDHQIHRLKQRTEDDRLLMKQL